MPTGGGSIQVARLFGIRIGVTPSWLVVLFVFILLLSGSFRDALGGSSTEGYLVAVGAVLLFYVSLVLHELGHALVARRQGIEVAGIDLWFFGGIARLDREPRSPGAEFAVAVAGPLVTLAIVLAAAGAASLIDGSSRFVDAATLDAAGATTISPAFLLLSFLAAMNLVLFVFNLAPAFPLDGGRIALAAAWKLTGDRHKATRFAGRAGVVFAYLLGGLGLFLLLRGDAADGLWLMVLAWLLAGGARAAVVQGTVGERLSDVTVGDVMDPDPVTLPGGTTLLDASERVFEPDGWAFVAVVDDAGRFLGVLRREVLEHLLAEGRPALTAAEAVAGAEAGASVHTDQPLEDLLDTQGLRDVGAVFAVDRDDVLRGVVTLDVLRRALTLAPGR